MEIVADQAGVAGNWKRGAQLTHLGFDAAVQVGIVDSVEHLNNPAGDTLHLGGTKPSRRYRRCAEAQAARHQRRTRIKGYGVFVGGDTRRVECLFRLLAADLSQTGGSVEIDQHQVVVGSPADKP